MRSATRLVVFVLLLCAAGWAQTDTGSIAGTVTDATGAVVPNANVAATDVDKNIVVRTAKTNSSGNYSIPLLPIGHYSLSIEAPGFQKLTQTKIVLNVGDMLTLNSQLRVGATSEQVTVEALGAQVETQSPQAATLVTGTQVRELSLNGRNWEQLVTLSPGVSQADNNDQIYVGAFAPQGTNLVSFSMNGGRREHNNFMIDGADNIDRGSNLTLLSFPSVDSIAEFRVVRGQYDPELGRADSGQVNAVTRSGTNSVHGNLYEFWRNDALNARPFASKYPVLTSHIPYLRYHDFGGTIGGPIWIPKIYEQKNKTFFFFSEEVRRNLTYTNASATVPTAAMLTGTFAHPVCVAFNAANACTATGTSIATTDPVAKAYIQDVFSKFPLPNNGTFGLTTTLKNIFNFREEILKIDHIFSQKVSISGKYARDNIPTEEAGGLFTGNLVQGVGTTSTNSPGHNYTLHATVTFNPTLLLDAGYYYSYGAIVSDPTGLMAKQNSPDVVSATTALLPYPVALNRIPTLTLVNGSSASSFGEYRDFNRNHQIFGNITKVHGSHTFKFGATYYHYNKSENAGGNNAGTFSYNNNGLPGTGGAVSFEQNWANFLLGRIGTFSQASFDLTADIKDNQFEYYAQDTWRIRPNITLSYGARHSLFRQPTDGKGLLGQFDPSTYNPANAPCILSTGNLDLVRNAGTGVISSTCNPNYDPLNGYIFPTPPPGVTGHKSPYGSKVGKEYNRGIAPRIGIAWDPWKDGKTSIRAGWGMFYDNGIIFGNAENDIFLGSGYLTNLSVTNSTTASPTGGTVGFSTAAPQVQMRLPINYKYPYTSQWSLDVQRQIFPGWIMDIGYYGNIGIHLPGFYDFNAPATNSYLNCTDTTKCFAGGGAVNPANGVSFQNANTVVSGNVTVPAGVYVSSGNTTKLNVLRPYIGWNGGNAVLNMYNSNYHGLQTQLQKQFKGNSLINIAYTWSHSLTNYVADRSIGSIMPLQGHFQDNWGPGIGDRRHVFTANFVWDLPWFSNQQGFVGHVLGGWEVSGIQTFQTGLPATAQGVQTYDPTGADCLGPSPCALRANQVGDPNANEPRQFTGWFNGAAFVSPGLTYSATCPAAFPAPVASVPASCFSIPQSTLPTSAPGAVRLPGFWRTDLSLFKNIKFTERFKGQFRFETFNTFNHMNPIVNSTSLASVNYNKILSARDPRIMQLAMKITF
jgi:hypothetical protein